MNFLQICQRTARECGVSGSGPSTVAGQTGELSRIVNWCAEANMEIERAHPDWMWMRNATSFVTVSGQPNYPFGTGAGTCGILAANFGVWDRESFRNYTTTVGTLDEFPMDWIEYQEWRNTYQFGAARAVTTRPVAWNTNPSDQSVNLGPYPNGNYTITGDYFRQPIILALDTDIPGLPTQFHMMPVYKAMMYYGSYESAPEVYDRGEAEFGKQMARLNTQRLPEIRWV